jgi:hypothetical protein
MNLGKSRTTQDQRDRIRLKACGGRSVAAAEACKLTLRTGGSFPIASLLSATARVASKVGLQSLASMRITRMLRCHDILGNNTCASALDGDAGQD